jgi:hypothetical protein
VFIDESSEAAVIGTGKTAERVTGFPDQRRPLIKADYEDLKLSCTY